MAGHDDLVALEACVERIPGVLGCTIVTDRGGGAAEIQAFILAGSDGDAIQSSIVREAQARGVVGLRQVFVFELEAESDIDDRAGLERAVEQAEDGAAAMPSQGPDQPWIDLDRGGRPRFVRVGLSSSTQTAVAEVALGDGEAEATGQATGSSTAHGIEMVAEATLAAVAKVADPAPGFRLQGGRLIEVLGRQAVVVIVDELEGFEMLGAALLRGSTSETAVRATLDAINRRLMLAQE